VHLKKRTVRPVKKTERVAAKAAARFFSPADSRAPPSEWDIAVTV